MDKLFISFIILPSQIKNIFEGILIHHMCVLYIAYKLQILSQKRFYNRETNSAAFCAIQ